VQAAGTDVKTHELNNLSAPPACVANGLIGLLAPSTPLRSGEARVNGCYEMQTDQCDCIALLPYPLLLGISVDGETLSEETFAVKQHYNFANGELCTELSGNDLEVGTVLFASRTMPTVAVQRTSVKAGRSLSLSFTASIDTKPARGRLLGKETHRHLDWYCHWRTDGAATMWSGKRTGAHGTSCGGGGSCLTVRVMSGRISPTRRSSICTATRTPPRRAVSHRTGSRVTMDIAFAALQYAYVSDDDAFVRNSVWPLLEEVCRFLCSRVEHTERGYEIKHVIGIDECLIDVDNNAYTNIAAKLVLSETAALAERLGMIAPTARGDAPPPGVGAAHEDVRPPGAGAARGDVRPPEMRRRPAALQVGRGAVRPPVAEWRAVSDGLVVPVDEKRGIILKNDTYDPDDPGRCIPETCAAFFPLTYRHPDASIQEATCDYHLGLMDTAIDYPMLASLFGVWACRRGRRDVALECFTKGIMEFLCDPYLSFSEHRKDDKPNFLTNPGGFLTACLYGLTGIQVGPEEPEGWGKHPVVLPQGWESIEVERIWIRGRPASLTARDGASKADVAWL